jgi:hypothetical protein
VPVAKIGRRGEVAGDDDVARAGVALTVWIGDVESDSNATGCVENAQQYDEHA